VALRIGPNPATALPVVWDLGRKELILLTGDIAGRDRAFEVLCATVAGSLLTRHAIHDAALPADQRPRATWLPVAREVGPNDPTLPRMQSLGDLGLSLVARAQGHGEVDPILTAANFLFASLKADYASALRSLESLDPAFVRPSDRLWLACLQAQTMIGAGQTRQAATWLDYLETRIPAWKGKLVDQPGDLGATLTPDETPFAPWLRRLRAAAEAPPTVEFEPPLAPVAIP
jgi:hypothetical protein